MDDLKEKVYTYEEMNELTKSLIYLSRAHGIMQGQKEAGKSSMVAQQSLLDRATSVEYNQKAIKRIETIEKYLDDFLHGEDL